MRRVPRATYRVQLTPAFGLAAAAGVVDYLAALGVSHLYASPFLRARSGSNHGYDIIDHQAVSEELGGEAGLATLSHRLARAGMRLVMDIVPNHMGVGFADNAWWLDLLRWGRHSRHAAFFDVDWSPAKPELRDKLLVPLLGDHYGRVLERGELVLELDERGAFSVNYFDHRFPLAPHTYPAIFGARATASPALDRLLARFRDLATAASDAVHHEHLDAEAAALERELAALVRDDPVIARAVRASLADLAAPERRGWAAFHELLEAQHYRLAFWRVAADEINYRRFFDINTLAAVRMELDALFDVAHRRVLELFERGVIHGVRVDHVDGLYDPLRYCRRLRDEIAARGREAYFVVEKILAPDERLRPEWPVDGTTGYDFMADAVAVLVDAGAERAIDRVYRRQLGQSEPFAEVLYRAKHDIMDASLGGELQVLANLLDRVSERSWRTRDFTLLSLRSAIKEVVAAFPVYRTYVSESGVGELDRRDIDRAVSGARWRARGVDPSLFDFVRDALTLDLECSISTGYERIEVVEFAMKFQEYTSPVMAKALEDTGLYRYPRLLCLNEVGSRPDRFGIGVAEFHRRQRARAETHPNALLATATHDHKRGEDARLRIAALSEMPERFGHELAKFGRLYRAREGGPAPADAMLLYQSLVGVWPAELTGVIDPPRAALAPLCERMAGYLVKALREGKQRSSWADPDLAYEESCLALLRQILEPQNRFLREFVPFHERAAKLGMLASLAQTALKLTVPGVPDIYQGAELWDLSLVDPDNRRPVDFAARRALLDAVAELPRTAATFAELLAGWPDGRVKLWLVRRLLALRGERPELFERGEYLPLATSGRFADNVIAFARRLDGRIAVVAVARLTSRVTGDDPRAFPLAGLWADTAVSGPLPRLLRDALTGEIVETRPSSGDRAIPAPLAFLHLPVAVLVE